MSSARAEDPQEGSQPLVEKEGIVEGELVPYVGCCSKGGLCAVGLALPLLLLAAAVPLGVASIFVPPLAPLAVYAALGGLALGLVAGLVVYFCVDNAFQIWALQHPGNPVSRIFVPLYMVPQSLQSCNNEWIHKRRLDYGDNFCCAGEVCVGAFKAVERALTEPQARTFRLGQTPFIKSHCPGTDGGPRSTFLLAMTDEGAGGNGDHHRFKKCMEFYLLHAPATIARAGDAKVSAMIEQLAKEYTLDRKKFFYDTSQKVGLEIFLIKYYHYVIFGLELEGQEMDTVAAWYSGDVPTTHYIWPMGYIINKTALIDKVQAIYQRSPALKEFKEGNAAYASMTKAELCRLMCAVVRIACKTGTHQLAREVLGDMPLPSYSGEKTGAIDVTKIWDELDLEDTAAIRSYIMEIARLFPPVNVVHRVATSGFTVAMQGSLVSFPAGTIVMVPNCFGNLDKGFWGPTTFEFNADRKNLWEYHMGFNSVGNRDAGRICPGREMALVLLTEVVRSVGKARRAALQGTSSASRA